jgi:hypothetical protein
VRRGGGGGGTLTPDPGDADHDACRLLGRPMHTRRKERRLLRNHGKKGVKEWC